MFSMARKNGSVLAVGQSSLGFFGGVPTLVNSRGREEDEVDIAGG